MPTSASGNELSRIYVQRINLINFLGRRRQFWVKMRKTQNEQMISALPPTSDIARQRSLAEKTISGSTRFHPMSSNGLLSCHEPVRRHGHCGLTSGSHCERLGVGCPSSLIAPAPLADAVDGVPGQGVQCPMLGAGVRALQTFIAPVASPPRGECGRHPAF